MTTLPSPSSSASDPVARRCVSRAWLAGRLYDLVCDIEHVTCAAGVGCAPGYAARVRALHSGLHALADRIVGSASRDGSVGVEWADRMRSIGAQAIHETHSRHDRDCMRAYTDLAGDVLAVISDLTDPEFFPGTACLSHSSFVFPR